MGRLHTISNCSRPGLCRQRALFLQNFTWRANGVECNGGVKSGTLLLKPWHVGKYITAHINYTDPAGNAENPTSIAVGPVNNKFVDVMGCSHATYYDSLVVGGWISCAETEPLDGVIGVVDYQWKMSVNGTAVDIAGAKSPKLIFTQDMVGNLISHTAEWTDGTGAHEGRWWWTPGIVRQS